MPSRNSKPRNTGQAKRSPRGSSAALQRWFLSSARDFPWRPTPLRAERDPYLVLVSEVMLQQTQASRVAERITPFLERFPTIDALASAPQDAVLALWSGMGYYRRAVMLHRCARAVVVEHGGNFPRSADALRLLPGVGEYTAGAIASLCYRVRVPAIDGNVTRVLMRLNGIDLPRNDKRAASLVRSSAAALVERSASPGLLNEALIELGATVCTPRSPSCDRCPLRAECRARSAGLQEKIPKPAIRPQRKTLFATALHAVTAEGKMLIRQRPSKGLWASMWEPPTIESAAELNAASLKRGLGVARGIRLRASSEFVHHTTHRAIQFRVYRTEGHTDRSAGALTSGITGSIWVQPEGLSDYALSSPHRRILSGE